MYKHSTPQTGRFLFHGHTVSWLHGYMVSPSQKKLPFANNEAMHSCHPPLFQLSFCQSPCNLVMNAAFSGVRLNVFRIPAFIDMFHVNGM